MHDATRCARAGVPEAAIVARSKGEIALAELDRLRAGGLRFGVVLADAGYGTSAAFRHGLDARGLRWAVGIAAQPEGLRSGRATRAPTGRARAVPDEEPCAAEDVLAALAWRRVTWRRGTKGKLSARFAVTRVRVGDGPVWGNNRHLPGDGGLAGGRVALRRRAQVLPQSNLPPRTSRARAGGRIKARWVCEQAHQQLKEELGLDHFEGRSWTGLHRHALMTCVAFAYLQHLRLAEAPPDEAGGKISTHVPGPPPSPSLPAVRQAIIGRLFMHLVPPVRCPHCRRQFRLSPNLKVPR